MVDSAHKGCWKNPAFLYQYRVDTIQDLIAERKYPIFLFPISAKLPPPRLPLFSAQSVLESLPLCSHKSSSRQCPQDRRVAQHGGSHVLGPSVALSPVRHSSLLEACLLFGFWTTALSQWSSWGAGFPYSPWLVSGPLTVQWPPHVLSSPATQTPSGISSTSVA